MLHYIVYWKKKYSIIIIIIIIHVREGLGAFPVP